MEAGGGRWKVVERGEGRWEGGVALLLVGHSSIVRGSDLVVGAAAHACMQLGLEVRDLGAERSGERVGGPPARAVLLCGRTDGRRASVEEIQTIADELHHAEGVMGAALDCSVLLLQIPYAIPN